MIGFWGVWLFPFGILVIKSRFMSPLYFGELPVIFWLAIIGAREPRPVAAIAAQPA